MKTNIILITAIVCAATLAKAGDTIDVNKLPAPVQQALRKAGESAPVREITVRNVDGKLVYDIELEQENAPNPRLRIAGDGTVLRDARVFGDLTDETDRTSQHSKLEELPQAVQATVKQEAAGREIGDIEREYWNGDAGYKITLREPGRNPKVYVKDDGTLQQPTEKPPGAATLFHGRRFEDMPPAVQQTIRREAPDGEIVKIERSDVAEPDTLYRVDLKSREGTFELEIYESGSLFRDSRRSGNP